MGRKIAKSALSNKKVEEDSPDRLEMQPMRDNVAERGLQEFRITGGSACLQDPFELNRNCMSNFGGKAVMSFQ